jgi:hypothetical protein
LLRNAQKRDKKKSSKTTEGEETKNRETNATFFVMAQMDFSGIFFPVFLNCPCYETPENAIKKSSKNKYKNK